MHYEGTGKISKQLQRVIDNVTGSNKPEMGLGDIDTAICNVEFENGCVIQIHIESVSDDTTPWYSASFINEHDHEEFTSSPRLELYGEWNITNPYTGDTYTAIVERG